MGIRFRKRFKLAPGLHLNLSGSGLSLSAGPRGASMTFGRRGTFFNAGIPGTGLYSRERIGSSKPQASNSPPTGSAMLTVTITVEDDGSVVFRDGAGNLLDERLIGKVKEQAKASIQDLLQRACDEINGRIEAIEHVHLGTPSPHEHLTYAVRPYDLAAPVQPIPKGHGILGFFFTSVRNRIDEQNVGAQTAYEKELREWQDQKQQHDARELIHKELIEQRVLSNVDAMETVLEESFMDIAWPRETNVSTEVRDQGQTVMVDVDLPEIEDLPKKTATVPARGYKLSIKELPVTRLQQLYMRHVHAVAFRIVGEVFYSLPKAEVVVLSGYSQRADKGTGGVQDEYLFSVKVPRDDWAKISFPNLDKIDVIEALGRFDMRREIIKSGLFRAIEPFDGA